MSAELLRGLPAQGRVTSPLPPHGTYARSVGRPSQGIPGCKCGPCAQERARYQARRALLAATGRGLTVEAAPTAAHVQHLLADGGGWNQLRAVSGASFSTISDLNNGRRKKIYRTTADKFLSIRLEDVLPGPLFVPAFPTERRLRALMAISHSPAAIAEAAGLHETSITDIVYGHGTDMVRPRTARLIAEAYEHLSARPGTHSLSRRRAAERRWAAPLAWDDIDDPDEKPIVAKSAAGDRSRAVIEDTAELAALGETRERIAARLGISWNAITLAHRRAGVDMPPVVETQRLDEDAA